MHEPTNRCMDGDQQRLEGDLLGGGKGGLGRAEERELWWGKQHKHMWHRDRKGEMHAARPETGVERPLLPQTKARASPHPIFLS